VIEEETTTPTTVTTPLFLANAQTSVGHCIAIGVHLTLAILFHFLFEALSTLALRFTHLRGDALVPSPVGAF
jgi:hypothetical protein